MTVFSLHDVVSNASDREQAAFEANLAIVKAHTIALDSEDSSAVDGRPGYKWVREYGLGGGVFQVPGMTVPSQPELPVLLGYNPKQPWRRMILDVDWSSLLDMPDYTGETFLADHADTHEWPDGVFGSDVVNVYPRALTQLRTYPGSAGLTVTVAPHRYVYESAMVEFEGHADIDLTPYQPASGRAVRLLVSLDMIGVGIAITAGTEVADVSTIVPQPPTFPSNAIWSALIRLDGAAVSIVEADILDIRTIVAGDVAASIAASAPGQVLISNDGLVMELGVPMVDNNGDILTDEFGYIVVT